MEGFDLVTEGTLTLAEVLRLLEEGFAPEDMKPNPAVRLATMLLDSDIVRFVVGTRINEAHQGPEHSRRTRPEAQHREAYRAGARKQIHEARYDPVPVGNEGRCRVPHPRGVFVFCRQGGRESTTLPVHCSPKTL